MNQGTLLRPRTIITRPSSIDYGGNKTTPTMCPSTLMTPNSLNPSNLTSYRNIDDFTTYAGKIGLFANFRKPQNLPLPPTINSKKVTQYLEDYTIDDIPDKKDFSESESIYDF